MPGVTPGQPGSYQVNGDNDIVLMGFSTNQPVPYFMPNGIADAYDVDISGNSPPGTNVGVGRWTPPVAGRWGEAQSVPGYPKLPNPGTTPPAFLNLVQTPYNTPIRAGYSEDIGDIVAGQARDAADDNLNSFDPFPPVSPADSRLGEVGDLDFLDLAGAFLLPVERMRRYVTPATSTAPAASSSMTESTKSPVPTSASTSGVGSSTPATSGRRDCRDR